MGGKSDNTPRPPETMPMPPQQDNDMVMQQMMSMMGSMMANMPQTPTIPQMPEIQREPIVNWAEKNEELASKMKADYNVDKARKKGRTDTILTSPLLEENETTDESLIAGE